MKLAFTYDQHHEAGSEWEKRELKEWVTDIFDMPSLKIERKCTSLVREHVEKEFLKEGWAMDVRLDSESRIEVFAMKDDIAFQLQTGNISRAPYDLIKLEYLYKSGRIEAAALALPSQSAAKVIGDNIACAERVIRELKLFDRVITVPILVIAFE